MLRNPILCVVGLVLTCASAIAWAWTPNGGDAKITWVVTWQSDNPFVLLELSTDYMCHFKTNEPNSATLTTVVMSAFLAGKTVVVYCYDNTENIAGYESHRLHRITVQP